MRKKILKMIGTVLFAGSLITNTYVYADSKTDDYEMTEEEQKAYEETKEHSKYLPKTDTFKEIDQSRFKKYTNNNSLKYDGQLPSYYSSKDEGNVSTVKNQDITGTCWCFAMLECLQDSAKMKGLEVSPDFSEYEVSYFAYGHPEDRLGLTEGDMINSGEKPGSVEYYTLGGNQLLGAMTAAQGIGLKSEADASFTDLIASLHRDGVAALPDSMCTRDNEYSLAGVEAYDTKDANARNDIKRKIMENGAGEVGYYHNNDAFDYSTFAYYKSPKIKSQDSGGHAVCIVGWDDNYPVENFRYTPPGKGAWLIKNSWGDSWGNDGYFWMSYYEPTLLSVYFFDVESSDSYDNLYLYDGVLGEGTLSGYKSAANVFTAKQNETINALSFFTYKDATDYDIYIYKNPLEGNPSSGELVYSYEGGRAAHMGYTKFDLPKEDWISLEKGDSFSVIVNQTASGTSTKMYVAKDDYETVEDITNSSVAGQSFVSVNTSGWTKDSWEDISANGANARIKAFTKVDETAPEGAMSFGKNEYEVEVGESIDTDVLVGNESILATAKLSFGVADERLASVNDLGRVTGYRTGETEVRVKRGSEIATAKLRVVANKGQGIKITKDEDIGTKDNPMVESLGKKEMLSYEVTPVRYKYDVTYDVEPLTEGIDVDKAFSKDAGGYVTFQKAGLYLVKVSIDDKDGIKGDSVEFYVDARINSVVCDDITDIAENPYENRTIKIYQYDTVYSSSVVSSTYDVEKDYDYFYIMGSDKILPIQEVYDNVRALNSKYKGNEKYDISGEGYDEDDLEVIDVLTGDEEDYSFKVNHRYLYAAISSDEYVVGSYALTDISDYVAVESMSMDAQDMDISLEAGDDGEYTISFSPEDAFVEDVYVESDDTDIADAYFDDEDKIIVEGYKSGKTDIYIYFDEDDKADAKTSGDAEEGVVTGKALKLSVTVTADKPDEFGFVDGTELKIERNDTKELELNDERWDNFVINYESGDPTICYVDKTGELIAATSGSTTIKATADVGEGDDNPTAIMNVTVTKPEDTTDVYNLQTIHNYVPGMKDEYEYKAPEGTECINIYFDPSTSLAKGDNLYVLDAEGKRIDVD